MCFKESNHVNKIILPPLGEDIARATVASWHYKVGDKITKDDDVVELVTDKASFNVPAPQSGVLTEVYFKEGQDADIGAVLEVIESKK